MKYKTLETMRQVRLMLTDVRVPENHIVIDFDIPDENGNKCLERNLEAASKSGNGIHLHYIYTGDPTKLSRIYKVTTIFKKKDKDDKIVQFKN